MLSLPQTRAYNPVRTRQIIPCLELVQDCTRSLDMHLLLNRIEFTFAALQGPRRSSMARELRSEVNKLENPVKVDPPKTIARTKASSCPLHSLTP